LYDNEFVLHIDGLTLNVTLYYEYVSDPPIFADLGQTSLVIEDLEIYFDAYPNLEDNALSLDIVEMRLGRDELALVFDGISDIGDIAT